MGTESQVIEPVSEWRGGLTHKILQYVTTHEGIPAGSGLCNGGRTGPASLGIRAESHLSR